MAIRNLSGGFGRNAPGHMRHRRRGGLQTALLLKQVRGEPKPPSNPVDQATDEGEQVWRQIKANTAAFSIGGIFESRARTGGGREIYEVDLLEVSATSTPVHGATRVLYWKSMDADLPRELVGTAWDPLTATGGSEPWTEDRLAEHKSITARARPVRIASFPV